MVTPCDCALSGLRAVPKTVNPRSASSRAVAWPMPDDAPVTKIVCDIDSPEDCVSDNNTRRRSASQGRAQARAVRSRAAVSGIARAAPEEMRAPGHRTGACRHRAAIVRRAGAARRRSEEHTSELQSRLHLVCRLLLEKKKKKDCQHSDQILLHTTPAYA